MEMTDQKVKIIEVESQGGLYQKYPGQVEPQGCYIELDLEEGTLSADNEMLGGGGTEKLLKGIQRRYEIPLMLAEDANDLMEELLPLAERVVAGSSWDAGYSNVELNEDAAKADREIEDICSGVEESTIVSWDADEWFREYSNSALGVRVGMDVYKVTSEFKSKYHPFFDEDTDCLTYVERIDEFIEKRLASLTEAARNIIEGYGPDREHLDLAESRIGLMEAVIAVAKEDGVDLSRIRKDIPQEWKKDFDEAKKEIKKNQDGDRDR